MPELKPCPFCGGKTKIVQSRVKVVGMGYIYHAECQCCGAKSGGYLNPEEPQKAWNRRVKDA